MDTKNDLRTIAALINFNETTESETHANPETEVITESEYTVKYEWGCSDAIRLAKKYKPKCELACEEAFNDGCGNYLHSDGSITFDSGISAGLIPAVSFAETADGVVETVPTCITLTRNCGFQHVGLTKQEMGRTVSICPLLAPAIVGGLEEPSAIIVPFDNIEALQNGKKFIQSMIESYEDVEQEYRKRCLDEPK